MPHHRAERPLLRWCYEQRMRVLWLLMAGDHSPSGPQPWQTHWAINLEPSVHSHFPRPPSVRPIQAGWVSCEVTWFCKGKGRDGVRSSSLPLPLFAVPGTLNSQIPLRSSLGLRTKCMCGTHQSKEALSCGNDAVSRSSLLRGGFWGTINKV